MSLLEIRNLRAHLETPVGVARAVDGVDMTVREGEAVGIVGESGSGKSVLALSILGLLPRGTGRILEGRAALADTMGDLMVDGAGAIIMSAIGYISVKYRKGWMGRMLIRYRRRGLEY